MTPEIIFATNNKHKFEEISAMLGKDFHLTNLSELGFVEDIPENEKTLEGNALAKAKFIYKRYKMPVFADDTGLEVATLNGEPGVYSARYSGNIEKFGSEKLRTEANIQKLMLNMKGAIDRSAQFRTVIAYTDGKQEYLCEGIVKGEIIEFKRGVDGFGYDPVFVPEGKIQTFAEMPLSEKNTISHRARAFSKFVEFIRNQSQ